MTISRLCSRTWRRQSVSSVTRPRSASTELRELLALAFDVRADLGRAAPGCPRRGTRDRLAGAAVELGLGAHGVGSLTGGSGTGGSLAAGVVPASSVCLIRLPSSIARSGVGRRALLDGVVGQLPGDRGDREEHHGLDQEARPEVVAEEGVVEPPGDRQHQQDQPEEREGAGRDADDATADEALDLLRDLGLGELDLLTDEGRNALGDVEDHLADRTVFVRLARGLVAHSGGPPRRPAARSAPRGASRPRWPARPCRRPARSTSVA